MGERVFRTLDEQIDILKSRGLIIEENAIESAKEFLLQNNYYRISGYTLTLRKQDTFYENVSIADVMDIYFFDQELRHIILKYLEKIEVLIKSLYAYEFSRLYGEKGYLDSRFFCNTSEYLRIRNKADVLKDNSLNDEAYIQHYVNDLKEEMPLWVYVDLLTLSDISILYGISKPELQDIIASHCGLTVSNRSTILKEYLHGFTILRNFCAHGRRLYNRLFIRKPTLNSREKKLLNLDENGRLDNAHLFGFVLQLKRILSKDDFSELKNSIIEIHGKYPFVNMKHYGFCDDWEKKI